MTKIVEYGVTILESDPVVEDAASEARATALKAGKDGEKAYQAVFDKACAEMLKAPALRKAHDAGRKAHEERIAKEKAAADKKAAAEAGETTKATPTTRPTPGQTPATRETRSWR